MNQRQALSTEATIALCLVFVLATVADVAVQLADFFGRQNTGTSGVSLAFTMTIGAIPLVAYLFRQQPAWRTLAVALTVMAIGTVSVLIDANWFFASLSLGIVSIGQQIASAALLIVAWRARSPITAVLAGVFVFPRVLANAVATELLRREDLLEQTPLVILALCLLGMGLVAVTVVRAGETGGATHDECSLGPTMIAGATLSLGGLATYATQPDPFSAGGFAGLGLVAVLVGFVVMGVTNQNRNGNAPAVHADVPLLILCGVVAALTTWVSFGNDFLGSGTTLTGRTITVDFDDSIGWSRALGLFLVLTAIPVVTLFARINRRLLAIGAAAIAVAGLTWVFFVLEDLEVGLIDFLLFNLLTEWGSLIVLGGTVAFALFRIDEASIEGGLIIFLAGVPLVESSLQRLPFELVGEDLLFSNFEDTGNLQLFTVASAAGLVWMAAWWALRPDTRQPSAEASTAEFTPMET